MSAAERRIEKSDIIPEAEFAAQRAERRAALLPVKKLRRAAVGPDCTFYFENYDTMLFQIQEMLLIEKGGEEQLADELAAYNPLIPQGDELIATVMFEIDNEMRRNALLNKLGGVEDKFYVQIGDKRVFAIPESDVERTRAGGKASSVHFIRFKLGAGHRAAFSDESTQIAIGVDHPEYPHAAFLAPATRAELAGDFA